MLRTLMFATMCFVLGLPCAALAHQAPLREVVGDALGGSGSGAGPVASGGRARVAAPPPIESADLRAALQATHADLEQCLATGGLVGSLRVTARVSLAHSLGLDITTPHGDAASHECAELVLRRALTTLAARPLTRALRATLSVRRRAPRAAPSAPEAGDTSALDGAVHAAIERDRSAMIACLSSAAPSVTGNATLRVTLAPDGSLALTSASLPTGVPAGPALPCLSARIAQLRFAPAPPSARVIEHSLPLGL